MATEHIAETARGALVKTVDNASMEEKTVSATNQCLILANPDSIFWFVSSEVIAESTEALNFL